MVLKYAETFAPALEQKYSKELASFELFQSNKQVKFIDAQTIKLPSITLSGYKDHTRGSLGFNTGTITNEWEPKKLAHDRSIEFVIDPMDVDETNKTVSIGNVQNTLEEEQTIPEKDSYVFSKLYAEATAYAANGATISTEALTAENILEQFDSAMEKMDEAGVPCCWPVA